MSCLLQGVKEGGKNEGITCLKDNTALSLVLPTLVWNGVNKQSKPNKKKKIIKKNKTAFL